MNPKVIRTALPEPHRRFFNFWLRVLRPVYRSAFEMEGGGSAHLPWGTPFIVASNHTSMMDWSFLSYYFPYLVRFVVHRDYFANPFLRLGLRLNGAIPLGTHGPDLAGMRMALNVLRAGEPLVIFPEGGISRSGRTGRGHPGVISLASRAQVPIVPAAISGADRVLPRERWVPRPGAVRVVFGKPLAPPPPSPRYEQRHRAQLLMNHVENLRLGRTDAEPPW